MRPGAKKMPRSLCKICLSSAAWMLIRKPWTPTNFAHSSAYGNGHYTNLRPVRSIMYVSSRTVTILKNSHILCKVHDCSLIMTPDSNIRLLSNRSVMSEFSDLGAATGFRLGVHRVNIIDNSCLQQCSNTPVDHTDIWVRLCINKLDYCYHLCDSQHFPIMVISPQMSNLIPDER